MGTAEIILGIEVSNPGAGAEGAAGPGVCVLRAAPNAVDCLGVEPVRVGWRGGHDDDLMPAIDRLFGRLGLSPKTCGLARVAVSAGPGGYTSVRVACAAAKMIAEATGARCVCVESAMVALRSAPASVQQQRACVLLASKDDSAWGQVFQNGVAQDHGAVLDLAGLGALIDGGVRVLIADQHLPVPMRALAEALGIAIEPARFSAEACARLGFEGKSIDPLELVPIYPREPDAVTLWRKKKASEESRRQ